MLGPVWSRSIKSCCPNALVKDAVAERETRRAKRGSMHAHLSTFYFPLSAGAAGPLATIAAPWLSAGGSPANRSGIKAESTFLPMSALAPAR